MNPEITYAFLLIGLRALSEYDPIEFRRVAEISKAQIDFRLNEILKSIENEEVIELYQSIKDISSYVVNPTQLRFLFKQIHNTALGKAEYQSILYANSETKETFNFSTYEYEKNEDSNYFTPEIELTRLSVMKLLRELPEYTPLFGYKMKNQILDCLLQPKQVDLPDIVVEVKHSLKLESHLKQTILQLEKQCRFFGRKTIGILITQINPKNKKTKIPSLFELHKPHIYIMGFNSQKNQFVGEDYERFLSMVKEVLYNL